MICAIWIRTGETAWEISPKSGVKIIEDRTQPHQQKAPPARPAQGAPPSQNVQTKRACAPIHCSQLNREVDSDLILNKILDSKLTLSVREVVGVSKDVANRLQDVLKVKQADFGAPPVSNLITTHTNALICIEVECNQKPVSFIADTGSQLNIISEKVCRNIVRRPINIDEAIAMNDANGRLGRLLGLVDQVPIQFGHIKTPISAYVAQNPPFDGLLGRPWQRAHRITIAERDSGTYLEFPNPNGPGKLDLLVDPMPVVASSPEVYLVMLPELKPIENGTAHITKAKETE